MARKDENGGVSLGELSRRFNLTLHGAAEVRITGVCTLQDGREGRISFLANRSYSRHLENTRAGAVIVPPEMAERCPVPALVAQDPYLAFARIAGLFYCPPVEKRGVHPSACVSGLAEVADSAHIGPHCVIEAGARIGENVVIGPGCTIGRDCVIGRDTKLTARVTLWHGVTLGARVVVQPGAVVGSRGFGLANENGRWVDVPQMGSVRVGDDVEIGANSTIDRGALEDTVIEDGVKLDNQIQIGHNVVIGAHTAIAGCTGIAGSTRIGSHCMIGGHVGINGHIEITDRVMVAGMTMVTKSLTESGVYASGLPVAKASKWRRQVARIRRLDQLERKLKKLLQHSENKEDMC